MSKFRFNLGPPSISRIYCKKCKEETLHGQWGICNHCGTKAKMDWRPPEAITVSGAHREWQRAHHSVRTGIEAGLKAGKKAEELARRLKCSMSLVWKVAKEIRYREQVARKASERL